MITSFRSSPQAKFAAPCKVHVKPAPSLSGLIVSPSCASNSTCRPQSLNVHGSDWSRFGGRSSPGLQVCQGVPHPGAGGRPKDMPTALATSITDDVKLDVKPDEEGTEIEYDEEAKTVRIPLSTLKTDISARRTKMVIFTCNKCGGRTTRLVNPLAWEKGVVFGQCAQCQVWHVLSANNPKVYEEIRYKEDPRYAAEGQQQEQQ